MQPETQTGAHSLLQSWAREMDVVLAGFVLLHTAAGQLMRQQLLV